MKRYAQLSELQGLVGQEVGISDWFDITQARIDAFAETTEDRQWIHVDPQRAASGPYGATVAHGFLSLSLLPAMGASALAIEDVRMGINYGLDRVRFPAPVRVGSRVRGHFVLKSFEPLEGGAQIALTCTMEVEGQDKPACVAESLSRRYV